MQPSQPVFLLLYFMDSCDIRICHHRVIGMIDDKSGHGSGFFTYMFSLYVVDFHFILMGSLGIMGRQFGCFLESGSPEVLHYLTLR